MKRSRTPYFAASAGVLLADQASKVAADLWLAGRGAVVAIPGVLNLHYSRNRGGLFGSFSDLDDPWRTLLLSLLPAVAVVAIAAFLARTEESGRGPLAGLALILGGAAGNLLDRLLRGAVVDFFDAYASWEPAARWLEDRFGTAHWPTFNVADSCIVIGAGLLLLDAFRPAASRARKARTPEAT